jgi:MoxR-like ATPase
MNEWLIYKGTGVPHAGIQQLPPPPRWRAFDGEPAIEPPSDHQASSTRRLGPGERAATYRPSADQVELVNAALYLRRPLLVTGKPGTGKSTLAYSVARELQLGPVLSWPITSRSTQHEGLYRYDALARLQDASFARESGGEVTRDIGRYIRLGPLGTALLPYRFPRVLLIDELDKSDIDLPNDLLTTFEDGEYEIPELARIAEINKHQDSRPDDAESRKPINVATYDSQSRAPIRAGKVRCQAFPLVIITSNGEREFPAPFLRRCLRLEMDLPSQDRLNAIVRAHLGDVAAEESNNLIETFLSRQTQGDLATDQLLNAIYLTFQGAWPGDRDKLVSAVLRHLNPGSS